MKLFRWMLLGSLVALAACGPSEQKKADMAEKKRIECLDKFCKGDVEPKRDLLAEVALKFHGQWYLAPSYYFSTGMNGAAFYWPSKKNRDDMPQEERVEPYANTIEIFLTGRQRWPNPQVMRPWEGRGWEGRFEELQQQGLRM